MDFIMVPKDFAVAIFCWLESLCSIPLRRCLVGQCALGQCGQSSRSTVSPLGITPVVTMSLPPSGSLELQSALFLAPSVTPWVPGAGTNPGVRLYSYSPSVLSDYSQYVLNLTASNAAGSAVWTRLYSAVETYGLADLGVEEMADLYQRLLTDSALFDTYYRLNTAGAPTGGECDMACKRSQLCAIGHMRTDDMANCLNSVDTMNSILSGEMLVHSSVGAPSSTVTEAGGGPSQFAAVFFGVLAGLAVLAVLLAVVVVRMRKRPAAQSTVLRNVASFVSVGSQGYETMT